MDELFLHYIQELLAPLDTLEMLAEADERMENVIFYMNPAAQRIMEKPILASMLNFVVPMSAPPMGIPSISFIKILSEFAIFYVSWLVVLKMKAVPK